MHDCTGFILCQLKMPAKRTALRKRKAAVPSTRRALPAGRFWQGTCLLRGKMLNEGFDLPEAYRRMLMY